MIQKRHNARTGDFTCGDFWKYWKYDKKLCDGKGLSIVLCNNKKAEKYMNLIYKEFKIYKKINIRKPKHVELELPSKRTAKREIFFNNYKKGLSTSKLLDAVSNVHYDVGLLSQFNGLNYGSALVAYAAYEIIQILKNKYQIYVNPCGGELATKLLRVSHIGNTSLDDIDNLLEKMQLAIKEVEYKELNI